MLADSPNGLIRVRCSLLLSDAAGPRQGSKEYSGGKFNLSTENVQANKEEWDRLANSVC